MAPFSGFSKTLSKQAHPSFELLPVALLPHEQLHYQLYVAVPCAKRLPSPVPALRAPRKQPRSHSHD